ncbi:MAG: hypothetical protein L6427_09060 [Actinomycetia bacterium]|nr:hypothetical protein [Actinomycetes bacterium]
MEFCFQCGGPIAAGSASCGTCGANPECIPKITHDIEVDDELAFKQGDLVVIRQISPNESRPQFKYVVYSETMKKFFQLSDNDLSQSIVTLETPPVDVESTRSSKLASSPDTKRQMEAIVGEPQVQQAASGRRLYRAIGITAAILIAESRTCS